ncbi:TPA: hypothetical protein ACN322_004502 [Vibrio parahaemolyticus]|nr:hypothetical protein [Vibrio parahaemolyticus]
MKIRLWFFVVRLSVSEADSLVESQLCDIVFLKVLFGVVILFSTALFFPSGFSNRRFESAPDFSFSLLGGSKIHDYRISLLYCSVVSHFVLESKATNKAFKRDSQRLAVLV